MADSTSDIIQRITEAKRMASQEKMSPEMSSHMKTLEALERLVMAREMNMQAPQVTVKGFQEDQKVHGEVKITEMPPMPEHPKEMEISNLGEVTRALDRVEQMMGSVVELVAGIEIPEVKIPDFPEIPTPKPVDLSPLAKEISGLRKDIQSIKFPESKETKVELDPILKALKSLQTSVEKQTNTVDLSSVVEATENVQAAIQSIQFPVSYGGGGTHHYVEGETNTEARGPVLMGRTSSGSMEPIQVAADGTVKTDATFSGTLTVDLDNADDDVLIYGYDGASNQKVHTDASGDLQVDVLTSALPTGAATSALQTTGNTSLGTIAGAVAGTEMQVDVLTMPTTTVTASDLDIRNLDEAQDDILVYGNDGATNRKLLTNALGAVVVVQSTAAGLNMTEASAAAIKTAVETIDNAISGSEMQVDVITSALPTGASTLAEQQTQTTALQLIDDTVYTDGAGTPSKGVLVMGTDATNPQAIGVTTDGYVKTIGQANSGVDIGDTTINNAAGASAVNIQDGGNSITVDLASTTITGTVAVTQSGTWDEVGINDSGNSITVDNTTLESLVLTEDDAHVTADPGIQMLAVRKATPANLSGTDGDYEPLQMDGGRLHTSAAQSGTWNVTNVSGTVSLPTGASTAANQATIIGHVDGIEGLLTTIDGDTGTIATDTTTIASAIYAEDDASLNLDPGMGVMAVRKATPANTSGADGDYEFLQMSAGRLWASATIDAALPAGTNNIGDVDILSIAAGDNNIGNVDIVTMPAVTVGDGTNNVVVLSDGGDDQSNATNQLVTAAFGYGYDGTTWDRLKATSGALQVIGQANSGIDIGDVTINNSTGAAAVNIQDGGNSITVDGTVTANLAAGTNNIGDVDILSIAAGDNNIGNVDIVTMPDVVASLDASASAVGFDTYRDADADNVATAVKAGAGNLYHWSIFNPNTSDAYLQFYDVAAGSVVVGTTTPKWSQWVPAGGAIEGPLAHPMLFGTAITVAATTTATGGTDPTTGLIVNLGYK